MRILVIEDDRETANYLVKAMGEAGHVADSAFDGEEGLERAKAEDYDVLVVDRMLPKRDGLSLISELRAAGNQAPVLDSLRARPGRRPGDGPQSRRRRLPAQALRLLRASGAGRGARAAERTEGGGDRLPRRRPGARPPGPQGAAAAASRSCCSRASSACSNI